VQTLNPKVIVKQLAIKYGFSHVGIARAESMDEEAQRLEQWLNAGFHGGMKYMEGHFDLRVDPRRLVPGAKSVISLLFNYHTEESQSSSDAPRISKYAYGRDYHKIVRKRLKHMLKDLQSEIGEVEGRGFVDSAPVMERDWARRAGNGWTGKNTLLIHPKAGSYFFLAELIVDLELEPDTPIKDHCGTCTKCIEACPTDAIAKDGYVVDGSKCISYLTIELKDDIPREFKGKMENWMFGCDICQQVCPWNRFSTPHTEPAFSPKPELMEMSKNDWEEITEEKFEDLFTGSPVRRTKFEGLKRNISFLKE
jgi:epoxyqueuosine reductase